jgi:hypothetical protein
LSEFVTRSLSLDFLLSMLTLLALPFVLQWRSTHHRISLTIPSRRLLVFRGLAVLFALWIYSRHVLSVVDTFMFHNALWWRTIQSLFTLLLYFFILVITRNTFTTQ